MKQQRRRLASRLPRRVDSRNQAEILLDIDESWLASGSRTVLQERMLEVYADFAGLRLQVDVHGEKAAKERAGSEKAAARPRPTLIPRRSKNSRTCPTPIQNELPTIAAMDGTKKKAPVGA